jgi:hypothetical protein
MPYPWGKEEKRLVEYYRLMGRIRHENDIYKSGDFKVDHLDDTLLVLRRYDDNEAYITVVNNSDTDRETIFDTPATELISNKVSDTFTVKAFGACIFKVARGSTLEI